MVFIKEGYGRSRSVIGDIAAKVAVDWHARLRKLQRSLAKRRLSLSELAPLEQNVRATIVSKEPPIVMVAVGGTPRLAELRAFGSPLKERDITFFLVLSWSAETEEAVAVYRAEAERYRAEFPRHDLIFLCNTEAEHNLFGETGESSLFVNQNMMVPESVFRPLTTIERQYDAVYSAKLLDFKRHHLAGEIGRTAYVTYVSDELPRIAARALCRRLDAIPNHHVLNPVSRGLPEFMEPAEVNAAYNRASVGLCLSAVEGAMLSSMEYMLAGLPIVSTPSSGGRDVFFDPDFCLIVDANPSSVREGVTRLIARRIPPQEIRERTLARVYVHRQRFLDHLNGMPIRSGSVASLPTDWSIHFPMSRKVRHHLNELLDV